MNPLAHAGARCALSVNVNKVALLRNTRALGIPSVLRAATLALEAGAPYQWLGDRGVVDAEPALPAARLPGADLLEIDAALRDNNLGALHVACATRLDRLKPVLRALVHYHLGSPSLRTRDVMRDARQLIGSR